MSRTNLKRLARLEAASSASAQIPVWCDGLEDYEATVTAMVAAGEMTEADRGRCVPWWEWQPPPGSHEAALEALEQWEREGCLVPH